jgi:hypothetical protein
MEKSCFLYSAASNKKITAKNNLDHISSSGRSSPRTCLVAIKEIPQNVIAARGLRYVVNDLLII